MYKDTDQSSMDITEKLEKVLKVPNKQNNQSFYIMWLNIMWPTKLWSVTQESGEGRLWPGKLDTKR